jgi:uncharacterized protein YhaN
MRIRHLRIRDVLRHGQLDLDLAPGLTVVRGPNEAGKSSVQRAIELALFRRCTASGREMEALRRWGAPEAAPVVELEFEDEGIPGRLVKRFAGARGTVELQVANEHLSDPAEADRRLAEMTGLPSEKFFRSTASVHHQELDDLERDEATLRDRLEASMSGATRGTSAAKRRLEEAVRRYTSEGTKNPGHLKRTRDEMASLEAQLQAGEAELARLEQDRAALSRARQRRALAEGSLAAERAKLGESERAVVLLAQKDEAQGRYERLRRAAELQQQIRELESAHPSSVPLPTLRDAVSRLRRVGQRISEIRAELVADSDARAYEMAPPPGRWQPWALVAMILIVAALMTGRGALPIEGAAPTGGGGGIVPLAVALALVVAAGILLLVGRRQRLEREEVARRNQLREEQIARRLRGRSELEQELVNSERDRADVLNRLALPDAEAAESLLAAETEHVAAIEQANAELRGLLGETPPVGDLATHRDRAAAEAEQKAHALAGMGPIGADPAGSRERYRKSVEVAQLEREQAMTEEAQTHARVEGNTVDAEQVAAIAERLAEARARLQTYARRVRIYSEALNSLLAAEQATIRKAARYLEKRMAADIARITGGRYDRVSVDEKELAFRVWSPERPGWVDVRELSQGTLDQFYLAARLGLVRQVTQDRRPPLLFDDPFVTFDDTRAAAALALLKDISRDHQVLYFTSSDRYDRLADRVVELPAAAADAAGNSAERPAGPRGAPSSPPTRQSGPSGPAIAPAPASRSGEPNGSQAQRAASPTAESDGSHEDAGRPPVEWPPRERGEVGRAQGRG